MPTKLELTILGRIAYFINGLKVLTVVLLLRLPVGRGGVLNSPCFCFFFFLFRVKSWGIYVLEVANL